MLEQILDLIKQQGQQAVVENADVPNDQNNAVMQEAASTITGGLQNILSGGGLQSIISMFSGNNNQRSGGIMSNPIVAMMVGHLANKLMSKFNLSPAVANSVSTNLIPSVLESVVNKTRSNDPSNDGFDLNDLVAGLTGGNAAANNSHTNGIDLQDILSKFTGGGSSADSQPDLSNVINTITQRTQQQQQAPQGTSITDLIGGFFR